MRLLSSRAPGFSLGRFAPALVVLALPVLAACNNILGIAEAKLEEVDAGPPDASLNTPPDATDDRPNRDEGPGPFDDGSGPLRACAQIAGGGSQNDCNNCVAMNCCAEYSECTNDGRCSEDLSSYDTCIGHHDIDVDAAGCTGNLTASSSLEAGALSRCIGNHCTKECLDKTTTQSRELEAVGNLCISYCTCMGIYCADTPLADSTTCFQACANLSQDFRACRNYHCGLAAAGIHSDAGVGPHCQHASGNVPGVCAAP